MAPNKPLRKRFISARETNEEYGLKPDKLRKMRRLGIGPEFRRVGYRTILYDRLKLERWIRSLPRGGGAAA
jgi:hypothetical protein